MRPCVCVCVPCVNVLCVGLYVFMYSFFSCMNSNIQPINHECRRVSLMSHATNGSLSPPPFPALPHLLPRDFPLFLAPASSSCRISSSSNTAITAPSWLDVRWVSFLPRRRQNLDLMGRKTRPRKRCQAAFAAWRERVPRARALASSPPACLFLFLSDCLLFCGCLSVCVRAFVCV